MTNGMTTGFAAPCEGTRPVISTGNRYSSKSVTKMVVSGKATNNRNVGTSNGSSKFDFRAITVTHFHKGSDPKLAGWYGKVDQSKSLPDALAYFLV